MVTTIPTWKEVVRDALIELNGKGALPDIYTQIEKAPGRPLTEEWKSTVRRTLQQYSSDGSPDLWLGKQNLFRPMGGGEWALQTAQSSEENATVASTADATSPDAISPIERLEHLTIEQLDDLLVKIDREISALESGATSQSNSQSLEKLSQLLNAKKQVVEQKRVLSARNNIDGLRDLVEQVDNKDLGSRLLEQLAELETDANKWRDSTRVIEEEERRAKSRSDNLERRSAIWRSFLERETIASAVGGLLLIVITITLIAATFSNIQTPEILNNSFLVILGYFFGQAVAKTLSRPTTEK